MLGKPTIVAIIGEDDEDKDQIASNFNFSGIGAGPHVNIDNERRSIMMEVSLPVSPPALWCLYSVAFEELSFSCKVGANIIEIMSYFDCTLPNEEASRINAHRSIDSISKVSTTTTVMTLVHPAKKYDLLLDRNKNIIKKIWIQK